MKSIICSIAVSMAFSIQVSAGQTINGVNCSDPNLNTTIPVFLTAQNGPQGLRFEIGNYEPVENQHYKHVISNGLFTSVVDYGNEMVLSGSFGTSISINKNTGTSFLSGMIDTVDGLGSYTPTRVKNHPMECKVN